MFDKTQLSFSNYVAFVDRQQLYVRFRRLLSAILCFEERTFKKMVVAISVT